MSVPKAPLEVVNRAEELYMVPSDTGVGHQYPVRVIAGMLKTEFDYSTTGATVQRWSINPDASGVTWAARYNASRTVGVTKDIIGSERAKKHMQEVSDVFNDATAEVYAAHYGDSVDLHKMTVQVAKSILASLVGTIARAAKKKNGRASELDFAKLMKLIPGAIKLVFPAEAEFYNRVRKLETPDTVIKQETRTEKELNAELKAIMDRCE